MKVSAWIEAMRLRTLPVSVAGVFAGVGYALMAGKFSWAVSSLCLAFAILAQIASNFANEYYDYKGGLDKKGREGPRRGVTEGDITPGAMQVATFVCLAAACTVGLVLWAWGPWWLVLVGLGIAVGVLAYSTGPYPLSHHGLGEVSVVFFFGIVPVNFTFYLQAGYFDVSVLLGSIAIGLMGANVLIVNNYRDMEDDASVGKNTTAVMFGRTVMSTWYLIDGYLAVALMFVPWLIGGTLWLIVPAAYLCVHTALWLRMLKARGAQLNPMLGITAMLMLTYCIAFLIKSLLFTLH